MTNYIEFSRERRKVIRLTNVGDQLSEQIQQTLAILGNPQTTDAFVETACSFVAVDLMLFRFFNVRLTKPFQIFHQSRLDLFVVKELRERVEFLMQELVCEVHLQDETVEKKDRNQAYRIVEISNEFTVVFMMPMPCVRSELAMC